MFFGAIEHFHYLLTVEAGEGFHRTYLLTSYYMNYFDFGFVKRGVLATFLAPILNLFEGGVTEGIFVITLVNILSILTLIVIAHKALKTVRSHTLETMLRIVLVLSPAGVAQPGYDFLRLDSWAFIAFIGSAYFLVKRKFLVSGVILGIGVMTHEALFVFGFPVIAAGVLIIHASPGEKLTSLGPAVLAAFAVFLFGNAAIDVESALPAEVNEAAIVWTRGLLEPSLNLPIYYYPIFAFYFAVPMGILSVFYVQNGYRLDPLILAPVACLALFGLGYDYARWGHIMLVSVLVAMILKISLTDKSIRFRASGALFPVMAIYLLPLGPIGIIQPLPLTHRIVEEVIERI